VLTKAEIDAIVNDVCQAGVIGYEHVRNVLYQRALTQEAGMDPLRVQVMGALERLRVAAIQSDNRYPGDMYANDDAEIIRRALEQRSGLGEPVAWIRENLLKEMLEKGRPGKDRWQTGVVSHPPERYPGGPPDEYVPLYRVPPASSQPGADLGTISPEAKSEAPGALASKIEQAKS
jgi:hypothetical protein